MNAHQQDRRADSWRFWLLVRFRRPWACREPLAQSEAGLAPLVQPAERTKAGFLARARALRDQAVREGDQAYGAVVVRDGTIVGEGRNYVVLHSVGAWGTQGWRRKCGHCQRRRNSTPRYHEVSAKLPGSGQTCSPISFSPERGACCPASV
jgi:hypothetical protein